MAEVGILQPISDFLKPIGAHPPTGEDISKSEDPVASAAYTDLEMEITKATGIDYKKSAHMAADILMNRSKHLRIAAWLCLSWFRLEGMEGLKNGLALILQLLQTFADKLFPEKSAQRSKAVQFVSADKRFQILEKIDIADFTVLAEIRELLQKLTDESHKQFPENPPDMTKIAEIIENRLNAGPESAEPPKSAEDKKEADDTAVEKTAGEIATLPDSESEGPAIAGTEADQDANKPAKEFEIPDEVSELLDDIDSEHPAGVNIEESEDQDALVVFMNLESEMAKYSGNDYQKCAHWAREILQTRCKHLRVAFWLLISWFRTENVKGFRNGMQLILELIKNYGAQLHPANPAQKSKILQSLNTDPRLKLFAKIGADVQNAEIMVEIGDLFSALTEQVGIHCAESPPKLKPISDLITDKVTEAKGILDREKKHIPQPEEKAESAPAGPDSTPASQPVRTESKKTTGAQVDSAAVSPQGLSIGDDRSARIAIKKALLFYFQEGSGDTQKRKIPEDKMVYALSRVFRWSKVNKPSEQDHITQLEGPNEPKQNYIIKLVDNKDWNTLIPEVEYNFISNDTFTFWLDAQRYVVLALEHKGGDFDEIAAEIKSQLACLVSRLPGLTKMVFKDKKTAFAVKETIDWIENEVMSSMGVGRTKEKILPPIMGEDYEPINKMYEAACEELPENFTVNAKTMQQAIDGESRKKGRFLRLLNLANYCHLAKQYMLAQPLFGQLMQQIEDYHICDWETALCVAVWQSAFLNNQKLLSSENDANKKSTIERQQKELFDQIVKFDAVLALTLENYIKNEGE